jgi:hypothetical protein
MKAPIAYIRIKTASFTSGPGKTRYPYIEEG